MKSKELKKLMATLLATTMVMGVAGCGNNSDPDTPSNPSTPSNNGDQQGDTPSNSGNGDDAQQGNVEEDLGAYTVRRDADGNVYDLGGIDVIIRDWWSQETEPQNAMDEARQEYLDWAQETYNFTVKQIAISSWGSTPEDFVNYATSGGPEYYLFVLRQGAELTAAMNNGLMYDLSTLDCLDFSDPKWGSGVHEMFSKGGAIYGMRGEEPEPRGGLFFNKRLLEEAGIDPNDIYKWQESGEWTWDKFEELCEQIHEDTDNDGQIDRWAIMTFNQSFQIEAVWSNNGDFIGMENGKYVNKLETEETLEALNWAFKMLDTYRRPDPQDAQWDYCYTGVINGEAAFLADEAYNAGAYNPNDTSHKFCAMVDDFGFVCFPKGPKASDYTNIYTDNVFAIPACYDADKAWKIAFVYDLWTEPTPGYEDESAMTNSYYSNFRDMESVDYTIARMVKNGRVTYHSLIGNLSLGSDVLWGINAEKTPAQKAEEIRNTWDAYIALANGEITEEQMNEMLGGDEE